MCFVAPRLTIHCVCRYLSADALRVFGESAPVRAPVPLHVHRALDRHLTPAEESAVKSAEDYAQLVYRRQSLLACSTGPKTHEILRKIFAESPPATLLLSYIGTGAPSSTKNLFGSGGGADGATAAEKKFDAFLQPLARQQGWRVLADMALERALAPTEVCVD